MSVSLAVGVVFALAVGGVLLSIVQQIHSWWAGRLVSLQRTVVELQQELSLVRERLWQAEHRVDSLTGAISPKWQGEPLGTRLSPLAAERTRRELAKLRELDRGSAE